MDIPFLSNLRRVWAGIRLVGLGPALRTALYPLRLAWYRLRFRRASSALPYRTMMTTFDPQSLQSLGSLLSHERHPQSLHLQCTDGSAVIDVITPHIVRVRLAMGKAPPADFSYAAILPPEPTPVTVREDEEAIHLSTPALRLSLGKSPLTLQFMDHDGRALGGTIDRLGWAQSGGVLEQHMPEGIHFYGLGERAFPLALRGRRYALRTHDPALYAPGDDPLYINIPFLVAWQEGRVFGLLYDNPANAELDLCESEPDRLRYRLASPDLRFDFILGPSPVALLSRYTALTGRMKLPPRWALGYHQSRWSYESAARVREVAAEFRRRHIPCEAIHLDIDYMDGFRCFTWNPETFPDPSGLVSDLHAQDFKVVAMIDPGIKVDPGYTVCADGMAGDMFCKLPDGTLFHGPVWPGECYFPDFTSPRVRAWWGKLYRGLVELGIDGFWNDMNEPTIFEGATFPNAVRHDLEGRGADHGQVHSIYGMQMVRATVEGLNRLRPGHRNWVFSRSGYAGVQRYASSWTGDNRSEWADLAITPAMLLNLGLSGLSFTGPDVGGFGGEPTPELFARWISMGAFTPYYRTHTIKHSPDQEPWSFGPEVEAIARHYIGWRYRLLPTLYTAFWQCAQRGLPIMRPLLFEDPAHPAYLDLDDQWLLGDHLLISPVLTPATSERVLELPAGGWYDFWTDERVEGPGRLQRDAPLAIVPVHVRAGAVLALGPVRQFAHEAPGAPLQLHLYPGEGESLLYEDDGESLAFERGEYRLSRLRQTLAPGRIILTRTVEGAYRPPYRQVRIVLHGAVAAQASVDGRAIDQAGAEFILTDATWNVLEITPA